MKNLKGFLGLIFFSIVAIIIFFGIYYLFDPIRALEGIPPFFLMILIGVLIYLPIFIEQFYFYKTKEEIKKINEIKDKDKKIINYHNTLRLIQEGHSIYMYPIWFFSFFFFKWILENYFPEYDIFKDIFELFKSLL